MLYKTREERLLVLEQMCNTRELGGYETQGGRYSKMNRFIRAASPSQASTQDIETLKEYGVNVVVDLRSDYEKEYQINPFKDDENVTYYEVNILHSASTCVLPKNITDYRDLGGFYIYMLEAMKPQIKELFEIFLKHPYDTILFHCSAGKDRTGVVAGLLLDLIGCHEYDIVKDYSESYENNCEMNEELKHMMDEEAHEFLRSSPRYMMELLDFIREEYGSAKEYLVSIGMSDDDILDIIENFTI